jgi:hypothetical protein
LQANLQDFLILASAGLSCLKSMISVGTYSCWHVVMVLIELFCSGIALTLFVMYDSMQNDGSTSADDRHIFLLAFSYTFCLEIQDVIVTYKTVRVYNRIETFVYEKRMDYAELRRGKKLAMKGYLMVLLPSLLIMAVLPIIAFYKANWETSYFAPSGFSQQNGTFLLIAMLLFVVAQGLLLLAIFFENDIGWEVRIKPGNGRMSLALTDKKPVYRYMIMVLGAVFLWIVWFRIEPGEEAGSLAYLLMINSFQSAEMNAETARLCLWRALENHVEARPMDVEAQPTNVTQGTSFSSD